jgi:RNA polymerase sigma-70 factor (ECF subfamily)
MSAVFADGSGRKSDFSPAPSSFRDGGDQKQHIQQAELAADRAFGDALSRLRLRLTSFARWLVRDGEAAEDLVQETLLRAWAARKRLEPGTNLKAWTYAILRNLFLSQRRRARFVGEFDEMEAERRLAQAESQTGAAELNEIVDLLEQIPAAQQQVLRMIVLESLSYEEAAERTGVAVGTIKSQVHRAREALKTLVNGGPEAKPVSLPTRSEALRKAAGVPPESRNRDLRGAWAAAKAAGRPLLIG